MSSRDLESYADLTYAQLRAFARPGGIIVGFVLGIGASNTNQYAVEASLSPHGRLKFVRRTCDSLGRPLPTFAQKGTFVHTKGMGIRLNDVILTGPFRKLVGEEEVRAAVKAERKGRV